MTTPKIPTDSNLFALPAGMTAPEDDGAARHLAGRQLPAISLRSTAGGTVNVAEAAHELSVFFFYPGTLAPGVPIPGEWSEVPGARGDTLENCAYRDVWNEFQDLNCRVFGVSGQGQDDPKVGLRQQIEFHHRVGLPFELLNDSRFELVQALALPTFLVDLKFPEVEFEGKVSRFPLQGRTLVKRLTFVAHRGRIERVFYPIFPPDRNAAEVLAYLRRR
jgi:peroxiredoxin